uniref:procollagen C-endopeptidase enhancer 2 n=1 Tax=Myxine glutinosa TaxID=7769 RepID=UPI00358F0658
MMWFIATNLALWVMLVGQGSCQPNFPRTTCGGDLEGDTGEFASPGFPQNYRPNLNCVWNIKVPEGRVIFLSFRFFALEMNARCMYDYVSVFNGRAQDAQRLGKFCGTFRPGALVSTSNEIVVKMVTDDSTDNRGFLASFSSGEPHKQIATDSFCGGRLEKEFGSFKSLNWPESNYPPGVTCSWHIIGAKDKVIELRFDKFDLEEDLYCRYDYMSIFDGKSDSAQRISKLCGSEVPRTIRSTGNQLFVQFVSDLTVTADGFLAKYSIQDQGSSGSGSTIKSVTYKTTMAPAVTTTSPMIDPCTKACKRTGTMQTNFCTKEFVIVGKVLVIQQRDGAKLLRIAVIRSFKTGRLETSQRRRGDVAKIMLPCPRCPKLKKGKVYIFMGAVDPSGVGVILPDSFVVNFKSKLLNILNNIAQRKSC